MSASGLVFGFSAGETEVVAEDENYRAKGPVLIRVVTSQSGGKGKGRGRGYPTVLVSEIDADPDTNEVVAFSKDDPPGMAR